MPPQGGVVKVLETERLILRLLHEADEDTLARINFDSLVTEFLIAPSSLQEARCEAKEFIIKANELFKKHKFCPFAVEIKETHEFIGFVGLSTPTFQALFMPAVEILWRIGSEHWGKGYAPEAAKAVADYAFKTLGLKEVVSFTVPANVNSIRVMEKIGMHAEPAFDFAHPKLSADHKLSQHVFYRLVNG